MFLRKSLLSSLALLLLAACQTAPDTSAPAGETRAASADPFWPADGKFPVPGRTSSWDGFRAKNRERRALFAERREQDQDAIVFVGDSITEGWTTLERDFADLGVKVANRGIGGDTTPNLIHRLQEDVLALNPRALVVTIGTNDLGENTSPKQIANNLRVLHRRIRDAVPNIPLAWCLVMPRQGGAMYPSRIRELNGYITEMVRTDQNATVVDTFTPLALPDGSSNPEAYVPDRLHLNERGYAIWRDTLKPVVAGWKLQ